MPERGGEWRGDRDADRVAVERLTARLDEIKSSVTKSQDVIEKIVEPVSRLSARYDNLKEFADRELERASKHREDIESDIQDLAREMKSQFKCVADDYRRLNEDYIALKTKIAVWGTIGATIVALISGLIVKYLPK